MPKIIIDKFVKTINSPIEKIEIDFGKKEVKINDMRFHPVDLFEEKEMVERFVKERMAVLKKLNEILKEVFEKGGNDEILR